MSEPLNRLGDRLIKAQYITDEQLNEAIGLQKRDGGLLGDVLVHYGYLTAYQLSTFIYHNQYSKLGELLIQDGLINQEKLNKVLEYQGQYGGRIGNICVHLGFLTEKTIEDTIAKHSRHKGRLGETLINKGIITQEQLDKAIDLQNKSGGQLGEILVFLKYIDQNTLSRELATQFELGRIGETVSVTHVKNLSYEIAVKYKALVITEREDCYILAVLDRLNEEAVKKIEGYLEKHVEQVLVSKEEMATYWEQCFKKVQRHKSVFDLYDKQPENSAIVTFTTPQLAVFISIAILLLIGFMTDWLDTLFAVNMIIQIIYAIMTVLKLYMVIKGEKENFQLRFQEKELMAINEKELPVYTILIPVYKEKEVIGTLLKNIADMDYPKYKLDVRILLEEDDIETIAAVHEMQHSNIFNFPISAIIVPKSMPQTKPKACNYGLLQARGEYVVIYDAEDRPESDQLKKAYLSFKSLPDKYVCIQAKLNYYNSEQNILTRLFTQEYSVWFENLLVGVMQMDIPVPLGGTSNHFKMSFLREVGGWDPFNVTEDADLGVRLFKFHYKTAVLDSRTWEEANSKLGNWVRQRSRWIKGYMQTWLVHMRHPVQLFRDLGLRGYIGYQAMVFGTPALPIINPFLWALMVIWFVTKASWLQYLFPGFIYYLAMVQLVFGNFMFTYTNLIGMYSVIRDCNIKKLPLFSYRLIKFALITPLYWVLMSVAAYKALFQLFQKPFYWEKTRHGLDSIEQEDNKENNRNTD
jgi:glycosyltransferase XagB